MTLAAKVEIRPSDNLPMSKTTLSMLDLVAVREGSTIAQAIATSVQAAQHAERLGFTRYWLAEHHNMPGLACSSTAVLVGHIAGATHTIRVGAGGIMLPNHAPLVVAEAFGTLETIYPGRIDLGLGRAPGTDQLTMRALRRNRVETEEDFPREVAELQMLLGEPQAGQRVVASPGAGTKVPIWLLGSSLFSAQLTCFTVQPPSSVRTLRADVSFCQSNIHVFRSPNRRQVADELTHTFGSRIGAV